MPFGHQLQWTLSGETSNRTGRAHSTLTNDFTDSGEFADLPD